VLANPTSLAQQVSKMLKKFSGLILYVLITILVISLYAGKYGFLERIDLRMQDGMFKLRGGINPQNDIIIVGLDEKSLDQIGKWPWTQDKLAHLISTISRGSPKVLVLDIFLPENINEDTSGRAELLANEMYIAGNVILPIYFNLSEVGMAPPASPPTILRSTLAKANNLYLKDAPSAKQMYFPDKLLVQSAFDFGHINMTYDPDNLIRREPILIEYDGDLYPSLALQTARRYLGIDKKDVGLLKEGVINLKGILIPTDKKSQMMINYYGPNLTFPRVSALDVLNGETSPKAFSGKIALVGLTAIESKTLVKVPSYGTLNEVERIANVIENIVHSNFLNRLSPVWNLLILILIGIFCALVLPKVSLTYRIIILLVFLFVMFNSNYILFSSFGILTQPLYPIIELLFFLAVSPTIKPKRLGGEEVREKSLGVEQIYTKDKTEKEQETLERQGKQVKVEVQTGTVPGMSKTEKPEPVSFETSNKLSSIKIGTEEKRKEEETITISTPDVPRVAQEITSSLQEETPKGVSRESTAHLPLTQFGRYKVL
jgi:adenylate cyclase